MSDISIPGLNGKYNSTKLVEDLMKVERVPKERAEERLKTLQSQNTAWLDLNRRMSTLRESSRSLYSFQNPFNERVAKSSDEKVLTATATREAIEETKTFEVLQVATADRFMSKDINKDYKVSSGNYVFTVGKEKVKINYNGGSLKDFVDVVNRKGIDKVRAQLVSISKDNQVLVFESLKTGTENKLGFEEKAIDFALNTGLVEKAGSSRQDLSLNPVRYENAVDKKLVSSSSENLNVQPGGEAAIKLGKTIQSNNYVLEYEVEMISQKEQEKAIEDPITGPSIPGIGSITYEGISISSVSPELDLPEIPVQAKKTPSDDFSPLYIIDGQGRSHKLPNVKSDQGFEKVTIPLPVYSDSFSGIGIRNGNSNREINIKSVKVYDPNETGGMKPNNPVDTANDAIIKMDGIKITRPTNVIDDLVPGLSLELWEASDKKVKLEIEPDRESVKETIIDLVGNYNRLMAEINILSRKDEKIVTEISYFTDEERKEYKEKSGMFQGDSTFTQIKSSLQRILMDNYATQEGLSLLAEFGISTDSRRSGGGYDVSRLRGYVEIDEEKLDKGLKEKFNVLKSIMGYDTDEDLLIDSGVAFKLDELMKAYVETGGIIATRKGTIDNQIARQEKEIDNLETQLEKKEAELKQKYTQMESTLGQMEQTNNSWNNFNKQNSGN